jgi:hypothetical protein
MDEHGSAEGGRTRLARGTKPNAAVSKQERADGANAGGKASRGVERSEMGGGDPDGSAGGAGGKAPRGIDARGSGPVLAGGAPSGAGRAPAQSICEAVEQLIEAQEADEAIAEWMQGAG